jgi:site-specific DNA-adenine methylase
VSARNLRPFFSYYGGKWAIAHRYPAPRFAAVVEPFAGSAGYSVRHAGRAVTLVDSSPQVAGTWDYLIRATPAEIRRLPLIEPGQPVTDLPVCQEAAWLIGWWLNKASEMPRRTLSAWAREPRYASQFWGQAIRERVAQQVDAIKHWTIIEGDYRNQPDREATWFVDPPYSSPAGRKYPRSEIDYAGLAEWCKTRAGQVIACDHDAATWLPFEHLTYAKATSGRHKPSGTSAEGVWVGGSQLDELAVPA